MVFGFNAKIHPHKENDKILDGFKG